MPTKQRFLVVVISIKIRFQSFSAAFKLNCILSNRHFWGCVLKHTKRQVITQSFLQQTLFCHIYNRNVYVISVKVEMA